MEYIDKDIRDKKEESLKSFRVFKLECKRLERLYDNSIYSYKITRETVYEKISSKKIGYTERIEAESYEGNKLKSINVSTMLHNLRVQYPSFLRQLIFIRLISALEIFLVDSIEETFVLNRKLFRVDSREVIEINKSEFLRYSSLEEALAIYIERECRRLHGQGYMCIRKFYLKSLGVDFLKAGVDANKISHLHDKRHILVHRLGKTDANYRRKYSTILTQITIEEDELMWALNEIFNLALYINDNLVSKIES